MSAGGLGLAVHEWGDEDAPPLLLAHGGFDFAGTFDVFAPLLADGGWRVVAWDQRGHGDSDHAVLYNWEADVRDGLTVLNSVSRRPVPFIGHSKGGSVTLQLADACPHRCSHVVNLDGLPTSVRWPDVPDHERTRLRAAELGQWLTHRASAAGKQRWPGTIEELADRRRKMNPRMTTEWLRYLVPIGAQPAGDDQWRWKVDPVLRFGGFGPWRPEWSMMRMPGLSQPMLGILATEVEELGWGTRAVDAEQWAPPQATLVELEGVGHFVHVERPHEVAALVLDFLGAPPADGSAWAPVPSRSPQPLGQPVHPEGPVGSVEPVDAPAGPTLLVHNQSRLALHPLRAGDGRPLLLLHGLAERSPSSVPAWLAGWAGPIAALDFTGHGGSTLPVGGGYTPEQFMADADTAVRHLGEVTVVGRGLGAYVALLLAGARADAVRGTVLCDGPGMLGAGVMPGSANVAVVDPDAAAVPDPFALAELTRDVRPADYATTFARIALESSPLEHPIAVAAVTRPEWLQAVLGEPGVVALPLSEAVAFYAG